MLFRNDGSHTEGSLASMLLHCPACHALPGTGCSMYPIGDRKSGVVDRRPPGGDPHASRVELLRALKDYVNGTTPERKLRFEDGPSADPGEGAVGSSRDPWMT